MTAPSANEFKENLISTTVTIANAATKSSVAETYGLSVLGVYIPASLTGTAISFEASPDNSTFSPIYYSGANYSIDVTTSKFIPFDKPALFAGVRYLKIVSNASEGGSRTLTLALGNLLG